MYKSYNPLMISGIAELSCEENIPCLTTKYY